MKTKCPACYVEYDLLVAMESEAGREMAALLLTLPTEMTYLLLAYIGLFRSRSRDLSHDRELRLAKEVLQLTSDHNRLVAALAKTTEVLREKQAQGGWKPLSNHNYLKQVLQGINSSGVYSAPVASVVSQPHHAPRFTSQRGKMLEGLDAFAND